MPTSSDHITIFSLDSFLIVRSGATRRTLSHYSRFFHDSLDMRFWRCRCILTKKSCILYRRRRNVRPIGTTTTIKLRYLVICNRLRSDKYLWFIAFWTSYWAFVSLLYGSEITIFSVSISIPPKLHQQKLFFVSLASGMSNAWEAQDVKRYSRGNPGRSLPPDATTFNTQSFGHSGRNT